MIRLSTLREPSESLLLDEGGELDEERTIEAMRDAERLDPLLHTFPELKEIVVAPGRMDRLAIKDGHDELTSRYGELREALILVEPHFDVSAAITGGGAFPMMTVSGFAAWIEEESARLGARLTELDRLCMLLKPGRDLPIGEM